VYEYEGASLFFVAGKAFLILSQQKLSTCSTDVISMQDMAVGTFHEAFIYGMVVLKKEFGSYPKVAAEAGLTV
jgi:hypothetical protein